MKNENLERVKLLMSYDMSKTLNENLKTFSDISDANTDLDEQGYGSAAKKLKSATSLDDKIAAVKKLFKVDEKVVQQVIATDLTKLSQEFNRAVQKDIKSGFIGKGMSLGPAAKEVSKKQAMKEILDSGKPLSKTEIVQVIERYKTKNRQLVAQAEAKAASKLPKNPTTPTPPVSPKVPGGWERVKDVLGKIKLGWNWTRLLKWGLGIGISGGILWYIISEYGEGVKPEGMPDIQPSDWAPCVQNLLDSGKGTINTNSRGLVSVKVIDEQYPQGVLIYSNGRIADIATRRMGRWTCKGGQVQPTNENKNKLSMVNIVLEQDESQLANDVETMIDLLDFPVTKSNLDSAYVLLKKYVDAGKSKEFLSLYQKSGFGSGDMKKSLDYVKAFNAETVQSKEKLENLLNRAMSGGGGSSSGSSGSLNDLDIDWDREQTTTPTPTPTTGGMTYFSCEDWDITTKPHIIGCTSSRIREVQSCLGLNPDGKFGPKTEKALKDIESDVSKGITLEIYNKVMRACGRPEIGVSQPSTPESTTQEPTTQDTTGQEPTGQETVTSVEPVEYGETPYTAPQETGEQFYNRLLEGGLLVGSTDNRRIKYKGVALTKNDFDKLTEYLATFGFYPMKVKEKGDEKYKYVWKLSQNQ